MNLGENMPASFVPYSGDRYWDYTEILHWCTHIAQLSPEWITLKTLGHTKNNNPITTINRPRLKENSFMTSSLTSEMAQPNTIKVDP